MFILDGEILNFWKNQNLFCRIARMPLSGQASAPAAFILNIAARQIPPYPLGEIGNACKLFGSWRGRVIKPAVSCEEGF